MIRRVDGQPFDLVSFTAKLLANTAGAGGSFEIMPQLNGVDPWPDPVAFDATGYAGNLFTYAPTTLVGFDTYTLHLYVDFALMAVTLVDPRTPPVISVTKVGPASLELSWPSEGTAYALEVSAEMPPKAWLPATNRVSSVGGLSTAPVDATGAARYYRLRN